MIAVQLDLNDNINRIILLLYPTIITELNAVKVNSMICVLIYHAVSPSSFEKLVRSTTPSEVWQTQVSDRPSGGLHCVPVGSATTVNSCQ